jgi:hypothetical protein
MEVSIQHHAPAALPPGKTRYTLYRRLGGPHRRSGRVKKIYPLVGFDPRTYQRVASRCTKDAFPSHDWRDKSQNERIFHQHYYNLMGRKKKLTLFSRSENSFVERLENLVVNETYRVL